MTPLVAQDSLQCSHGGKLVVTPSKAQVSNIKGSPMITISDLTSATIVGCPFNVSGAPKPCTSVVNASGATSPLFSADGEPVVIAEKISSAVTDNGVPIVLTSAPLAAGVFDLKS